MELTIEYLPKEQLKPYIHNAKTNPASQVEQIKKSIEEFGFNDPIAVWGDDEIVEGHGRLMAVMEMPEIDTVPVIRLDHLSDEEKRAYALVHNKLTMNSDFDMDLLFEELEAIDLDMSAFGFDVDDAFIEIEDVEETEVPSEAETRCKEGDLWILGEHRLICGDSTSITTVDRLMGEEKADLFLTDPPYNVEYEGATEDKLTIMNDSMDDASFLQFLIDAFTCADMSMRAGAGFYIWHADSEGYNFRKAVRDVGWEVRQCLIWNKNTLVLGRQDYQWKHEPCLYGWKEGASHTWNNDRKQTTVLDFDRPQKNAEHPTMKPVGLFSYLIQNSTHKHEIVLDLFGGSGTSIIACEQLGRRCYSSELDPKYCDVILERWENLTGKKAMLKQ